jgi:hypothetical protein
MDGSDDRLSRFDVKAIKLFIDIGLLVTVEAESSHIEPCVERDDIEG